MTARCQKGLGVLDEGPTEAISTRFCTAAFGREANTRMVDALRTEGVTRVLPLASEQRKGIVGHTPSTTVTMKTVPRAALLPGLGPLAAPRNRLGAGTCGQSGAETPFSRARCAAAGWRPRRGASPSIPLSPPADGLRRFEAGETSIFFGGNYSCIYRSKP